MTSLSTIITEHWHRCSLDRQCSFFHCYLEYLSLVKHKDGIVRIKAARAGPSTGTRWTQANQLYGNFRCSLRDWRRLCTCCCGEQVCRTRGRNRIGRRPSSHGGGRKGRVNHSIDCVGFKYKPSILDVHQGLGIQVRTTQAGHFTDQLNQSGHERSGCHASPDRQFPSSRHQSVSVRNEREHCECGKRNDAGRDR